MNHAVGVLPVSNGELNPRPAVILAATEPSSNPLPTSLQPFGGKNHHSEIARARNAMKKTAVGADNGRIGIVALSYPRPVPLTIDFRRCGMEAGVVRTIACDLNAAERWLT